MGETKMIHTAFIFACVTQLLFAASASAATSPGAWVCRAEVSAAGIARLRQRGAALFDQSTGRGQTAEKASALALDPCMANDILEFCTVSCAAR